MSSGASGENAYCTVRSIMRGVADFRRITGGEESLAYAFRSAGGEYVLRVNRNRAGFEKDAFAYRRFARKELPIPEVVRIGELQDGNFYCISRKLAGRTVQDLLTAELPGTLEATVRAMRNVANSPVEEINGFGPFEANGEGQFRSWREFLFSVSARDSADPALVEIVRRFADFCPEIRSLVHGDFGSNNVLTDGRRITGVLDWSEAMIGDPLYDVANVFFWRGWLDCMEMLARYLEKQMHPIPNWRERVLCYQACIALRELAV